MSTAEFIALVAAIAALIKAFDWVAGALKSYLEHRREAKKLRDAGTSTEVMAAVEKNRIDAIQAVDFGKLNRENLETVGKISIDLAQSYKEQAETAHAEVKRVQTEFAGKLEQLEAKFESIEEEKGNYSSMCKQLEQQIRMLCDTLGIAFWAVTPDGHLEGNYTFFEVLTGLDATECHNDGWFQAIEEAERHQTKTRWQIFVNNFATKPSFTFTFKNVKNGNTFKTKVFCHPLILDGMKVYKFTAQTSPLQIIQSAD